MDKFLVFLSNNYVYFLIASGVLAFALIGFLFDIKKKKDEEKSVGETIDTNIEIPNDNQIPNDVSTPNVNEFTENNTLTNDFADDFNPAPPMPETISEPSYNSLNETNINSTFMEQNNVENIGNNVNSENEVSQLNQTDNQINQ